jgi:hypothetical protein
MHNKMKKIQKKLTLKHLQEQAGWKVGWDYRGCYSWDRLFASEMGIWVLTARLLTKQAQHTETKNITVTFFTWYHRVILDASTLAKANLLERVLAPSCPSFVDNNKLSWEWWWLPSPATTEWRFPSLVLAGSRNPRHPSGNSENNVFWISLHETCSSTWEQGKNLLQKK